jgi:prophage regulatory protein
MDRILRGPDIEQQTGYTLRTIRNMERDGKFPKRFKLNPDGRAVGWLESEVRDWLEARAASRNDGAA